MSTTLFAQIPEWVLLHPELESSDVRLYAVLNRFGREKAWPSQATLAEHARLSVATVKRSLVRLRQVGAVRWSRRQTSSIYELAFDAPSWLTMSDQIAHDERSDSSQLPYEREQVNESKRTRAPFHPSDEFTSEPNEPVDISGWAERRRLA